MTGTIRYVNEKDGQRGKYLTLALEDGTKGLVVNDEKIMDLVKEGMTYDFQLEKSGVYTIVTDAIPVSESSNTYNEDKKTAESLQKASAPTKKKPKYQVGTLPMGGHKPAEYMKRRVPEEQISIASQAYGKSLIGAYAQLWINDKHEFSDLDDFNETVKRDVGKYVEQLKISKE